MATRGGKNQVTLTFAGDSDQLEKTFGRVGEAADQLGKDVDGASTRLGGVGEESRRAGQGARDAGDGFERAAEGADNLDTRAMGFRDTLTGAQDSMAGAAAIARGDLFEGLFLAGAGVGDLASGTANLLVPALKSARDWIRNSTRSLVTWITTARGATIAAGAVGIALAAVAVAYTAFQRESVAAQVETRKLVEDLEFLSETGRATGDVLKLAGGDTAEFSEVLGAASQRMQARDTPIVGGLVDELDRIPDVLQGTLVALPALGGRSQDATERIAELDAALVQMLEQGGDAEEALLDLAEAEGLTERETEQLIEQLPRYREELERVEQQGRDTADAHWRQIDSLNELADTVTAQTDPVFAFVQAQNDLREAQEAVTEAQEEHGEESREHRQALLDLAEAELGLTSATGAAEDALDEGLLPVLREMRDDGILSKDAFRELEDAIEDAGDEAREQDGTRVRIHWQHIQEVIGNAFDAFGPGRAGTRGGGVGGLMPAFHTGGHASGAFGREFMAILEAGERITPASPPEGARVTVEAGSRGSSTDQAVAQLVLNLVRTGSINLSVRDGRVVVPGG